MPRIAAGPGPAQRPGRSMLAGKSLRLERGLAEIEFDCGARVILQGPAGLELLSGSSARLLQGTAHGAGAGARQGLHRPDAAQQGRRPRHRVRPVRRRGGRGDRPGLHRRGQGVPARSRIRPGCRLRRDDPPGPDGTAGRPERSTATSPARGDGEAKYVRAIEPPPIFIPRTLRLDFNDPLPGTLQDADGRGIGLTHRLPGTGADLPDSDPNLRLRPDRHALELTTTRSDINTQDRMSTGEYLGVRLCGSRIHRYGGFRDPRHDPEHPRPQGRRPVRAVRRHRAATKTSAAD